MILVVSYLETNNIINPKQLENETEVNSLINDIIKLDANKFRPKKAREGKVFGKKRVSENLAQSEQREKLADSSRDLKGKQKRRGS